MAASQRAIQPRVALADEDAAARGAEAWTDGKVLGGAEGLVKLVVESGADLVLNSLVGSAGLGPTVATLGEGIDLALANKESLVVGGELVTALAEATGARIVPVDSEHTALHQLISGQPPGAVERITITASGGPFRGRTRAELAEVTVEQALDHPTWAMGGKITIDSATLMNKHKPTDGHSHHLSVLPPVFKGAFPYPSPTRLDNRSNKRSTTAYVRCHKLAHGSQKKGLKNFI